MKPEADTVKEVFCETNPACLSAQPGDFPRHFRISGEEFVCTVTHFQRTSPALRATFSPFEPEMKPRRARYFATICIT